MPSPPLGPTQTLVLRALARWEKSYEDPPTPDALSWMAWAVPRPAADARRVANALRSLERKGLTKRLGWSATNARCWSLTDEGRKALNEEK